MLGFKPGLCFCQGNSMATQLKKSYEDGAPLLDEHLQEILTIRCFDGVMT